MDWLTHQRESRPWVPRQRQGSRADRTLERVVVSIPPRIGDLDYETAGSVARAHDDALIAVARLEAGFGDHLAPLADFLLCSESVASSKIEHIDADTAQQITGITEPSTYRALNRLTETGILEVLSASKRNRIWAATDVLAELDALSAAIGKRTTDHL